MRPLDAIRERIRADGPITFADYMEAALYGPGGFYQQHPVGRGPGSDFLTSPHISPLFAELLAHRLTDLAGDDEVRLVELGAGDGTLAVQLRDRLADRLDYTAVEISPGATATMKKRGLRTADLAEAIPPGWSGVILAHELLDNLPFHRVRMREGVLEQLMVANDEEGGLRYEARPCPAEIAAATPTLQESEEATVSLLALELIRTLAIAMSSGVVLIVDYGSRGGPWGYRDHSRWTDLLDSPGSSDITAGVNFAQIAGFASTVGFTTDGSVSQRKALMDAGFAAADESLREEQARAQDDGRSRDAISIWSLRREARLLVEPSGLGSHRWMELHLPGKPAAALT